MKIAIIGASGNIGSCAAFSIALSGLVDELVMIDDFRPDHLRQYASDLRTAVNAQDVLVRAGKYQDMDNSDLIIMAAGSANVVKSRMEVLPQNVPIVQEICGHIKKYSPGAIVIIGTNPVCPLNYAMYLCSGMDRKKLIGYSANDSIRFREFAAQALGMKGSRVEATVIGEHGNSQVLLFSSIRVDGKPYAVSEDVKKKVKQDVANLPAVLEELRIATGRTAAWTTAIGLTNVCRAIIKNSGEMIPCSVTLDGEYGCRDLSMTVPAVLGIKGVREILEWKLPSDEQEALNYSIGVLKPAMKYVEEFLGKKR
jgi:malate dehydrogenase